VTLRRITWLATMALLTALVAATSPAFPQDAETTEGEPAADSEPESEAVEKILQQQEALLSGQSFSYDPGDRRDPFRNLMEIDPSSKGVDCTKGIRCMVISEIDLGGIVKDDSDGDVAMFTGSDNKGYFLRVGDAVFDGTIIGIDPRLGVVTFRQEIDDPRRIKPYRDVKKSLLALDNEESIR
jgi:hypothetical protein